MTNAGEMLKAVHSGNLTKVNDLLGAGVHPDEVGVATPLYFAAQAGNLDIAAVLITHGADVNALSQWGTPLHIAARRGHSSIARLLLENGANPNAIGGDYDHTPMHEAAYRGAVEVGELLIEHGGDIIARSRWFEPPIHFAAKKGRNEFVELLHASGWAPMLVEPIATELSNADLDFGREVAFDCMICHKLHEDQEFSASEIPGPDLWGVVGRSVASLDNFDYSEQMKAQGGSWTYERLNAYIADPAGFIPGVLMFRGGQQDRDRRIALIAYLRTLSDDPVPLP